MSSPQTISTPVRRFVSILLMLLLLAVFLSLYFFKYVPEQKSDYNKRAFMELKSVTDAFSRRDAAYQQVFSWTPGSHSKQPDTIGLEINEGNWKVVYRSSKSKNVQYLGFDSLMHLLTDGDRDIFDTYLTILQSDSPRIQRETPYRARSHKGEIVFNAGDLSMDYQVDMDTLLKKSDGFGTTNIHDVKIEGNDYKLFLYPFPFHDQRTIMAGLISVSHYTSTYESVPINLITTASILLLLLLVAIPLLKIYIIGSHERIRTFDLRMIIGTYFVGGLVLFFLFAWNFLGSVQTANNKLALRNLAIQLDTSFCQEIDTARLQLKQYDSIYRNNSRVRDSLGQELYDSVGTGGLSAMHPHTYRQFDDVFWIDTTGKWVARWGFKQYRALPLIHVDDRQYFQNMRAGNVLMLKEPNDTFTFCLDPTLSKLDDKFVSNIIIPSTADSSKPKRPIMLGLSVTMYSVCNTVLPPGYGFSIIDHTGKILFNSKMDRSLLSSIYDEFRDQSTVEQYVRYRQERYFPVVDLHGEKVALLTTPLGQLPFTLIVHYALGEDEHFQLHILSLVSFFIGAVILLLIMAAYCNEWYRSKASLVSVSLVNFDWLRPVPAKSAYYRHLLRGMLSLAIVYVLVWVIVECFVHEHEFSLLAISLLLPFYLSVLYYLLREKQKAVDKSIWERKLPVAALAIPVLTICTIMIYLFSSPLKAWSMGLIILTQVAFITLIANSLRRYYTKDEKTGIAKMLPRYVLAVVTGVLLSVIVPSMAIFCFFFKEESRTRNKQERLAMAHMICDRKDLILRDKTNYSFYKDSAADRAFLLDLKLYKGVYHPDEKGFGEPGTSQQFNPAHPPKMYYALRNFLFPGDTTALTFGSSPERAGDSSWIFVKEGDSEVLYHNSVWQRDGSHVRLPLAHNTTLTALELLRRNATNLSLVNILLFILTILVLLGLFAWITTSLASRIFLLGLFKNDPDEICQNDTLTNAKPPENEPSGLLKKMAIAGHSGWTASSLRKYEEGDPSHRILYVQMELKDTYKRIWDDLSSQEKFVAYDFAIDNLANYKAGSSLYNLIRKGILCVGEDDQLHFITHSLHNYILDRSGDKAIVTQMKKAREQGSWQRLRVPLFLLLSAAGIFVFLTQDAIYQKMTGLLTSIGSLVPLISQFFNKSDK